MFSLDYRRKDLVRYLKGRGFLRSRRVIRAFKDVPRELFVPEERRKYAYDDSPLPIGGGQTISAPHMVAVMTELLKPRKRDKVLEIGAGSGYQAAILAKLVKKVYTVEFDDELASFAEGNLKKAGIKNVEVIAGDGSLGYSEAAPYKKIIVTCGTPEIPEPLIEQLDDGGRLIAPVGGSWLQTLTMLRKKRGKIEKSEHGGCVFVMLRTRD